MDLSNTIASAAPREGMNDLYQQIYKYVYDIRMIEFEEYIYGMNRKKIDREKAYKMIIEAPDSESNPLILFWKARLVDPDCIYRSSRVEKNFTRAIALYEMAVDLDIERMAEDGDRYAQACLGRMYHYGRGVDENHSLAVKWFRKAAEQGYAEAQFSLGWMYQFGEGVDKNHSRAVEWYRIGAEQGDTRAHFNLALIYLDGRGVDKNHSRAVEWHRKAAEQGHANAQYYLGYMYQYGWSVDKNHPTAVEWYRKAAEQGHEYAQIKLDRLTKSIRTQ